MRAAILSLSLAAGLLAAAAPAPATVLVGDVAPAFTKNRLGGGTASLSDFAGKVLVLFLFGYNCPVCLADAPGFESSIHQYYAANYPGQVQVLGVDSWNGTVAQVTDFRDQTGVTFPLLLNGSAAAGGNFDTLYGPWDNYIVVSKQGRVRYHAATLWPHGNRQHLNEIRGSVDTLVSAPVSVEGGTARDELRLAASPNPFRSNLSVELTLPRAAERARVDLLDVTGRRVAMLHQGELPPGRSRFEWRAGGGIEMAPGVYLLAAEIDGRRLRRRVVRLP